MKKKLVLWFLIFSTLLTAISLSSCNWFSGRNPELQKKEMKYEAGFITEQTVPLSAAEAETYLTVKDKDLIATDNYTVSYSKRSSTSSYDEWCTMGANDDIFYPGALLDIREESVKPLNIGDLSRAPITISTNLETVISQTQGDFSTEKKSLSQTIQQPALSSARNAIKTIVNDTFPDLTALPSNITMSIHEINSKDELEMNLGLGLSMGGLDFSENFDLDAMNKQTNLVIVFKQIYYSVDCDYPGSPKDFFADNPSAKALEETLDGTIPTYVASVNYGRLVVMSIQTNYTKAEVINALTAGYNSSGFKFLTDLGFGSGVNLDFTIGSMAADGDTKISYFEYGGSEKNSSIITSLLNNADPAQNEAIFKQLFSGTHNPNAALPISYTIRHLDGSLARIEDEKSGYVIKEVEYVPKKVMEWSALKDAMDNLDETQSSLTLDLSRMINYDSKDAEGNETDDGLYNANYTIVLPKNIKTFTLIGPNDGNEGIVFKNLASEYKILSRSFWRILAL